MQQIVAGVLVLLVAVIGYRVAWRLSRAGRWDAAVGCIMLCGLLLRLYTGSDPFLHEWDERYHALVAKNLLRHFPVPTLYDHPLLPYDFRNWTANHIWLHKQPLALWLMAGSIKVFGLHAVSVRVPAILLSTLAIRPVYDIARCWYGERAALITAFLFSIHGLIIELAAGRAATDSVDAVYLFFVVLAVWLTVRAARSQRVGRYLLAGAVLGLAVLTKWLPALIVFPVWLCFAWPQYQSARRRMAVHGLCLLAAAALVAVPWQLYILRSFPVEAAWEYGYNSRHFIQALEGHEGSILYHFDQLRIKYGEAVYLPVAWATWRGLNERKAVQLAVLVWFWGVYGFFSLAATKMEAYTIIAAPAVLMMTADAFVWLQDRMPAIRKGRWAWAIVGAALLLLPVRYTLERLKPFTVQDMRPEGYAGIEALQRSALNQPRTVVWNSPRPVETMFYTECTAYDRTLTPEEKAALETRGYVLVDARALPATLPGSR